MSGQNKIDLSKVRREYGRGELLESKILADPVVQFGVWFREAQAAEVEPNAMTLATVDASGAPSARVVLLKAVETDAFVFITNYTSRKGRELEVNPRAALVFFWPTLERQVRIEGRVDKIARNESEVYFYARPHAAQIAALTSRQSQTIASRPELERRNAETEAKYAGQQVPLPEFWGGYRLVPSGMEFWQGRAGRLHDRIVYARQGDHSWQIRRLQP
ncbi:MAG TPA: pyridoxamine 5'-phosphate oxidase [Tepidisphaeraceae bacterium]|jgi:pyridoxamine 5'-phosphate oxidase|nr:pyridoxamine 5'-phosphate oxidase [Tepidisphaeraceae bacterium]